MNCYAAWTLFHENMRLSIVNYSAKSMFFFKCTYFIDSSPKMQFISYQINIQIVHNCLIKESCMLCIHVFFRHCGCMLVGLDSVDS